MAAQWLPLLLVSFPSFSLLPTPNRPCQSERRLKARHEADSFEPAEWSERLTPGQLGWLSAAAVGSIPALALSLFLQCLYFLLFLQCLHLSLRDVLSAAILLFVLRRFVLVASSACFFPSFSLLLTPNRPCQSERSSKACHEADSFEPAEWSEQLTPGQSGWLGAAAVGSIPPLALSLFLQCLYFLLFLQTSLERRQLIKPSLGTTCTPPDF